MFHKKTLSSLCLLLCCALLPLAAQEELVTACNSISVEFNPHHSIYAMEAQLFTATYEGLFSYDPQTLEPVNAACESYKVSPNGLVYTFTLRSDARWSDGSQLKAADFRSAWLELLNPKDKADYASFCDIISGARSYRLGKNRNQNSVGIKALDDRTLEVTLSSPAAYFTRLLCHHSFSPVHPSLLGIRDWSARLPFPVDGPYTIVSYKAGRDGELILQKNDNYWDAKNVQIPKLKIILSDDDEEATRLYNNGEINWLSGPMKLDSVLAKDDIQASPMFSTQYWYFNCSQKPWNSADLRRGLALILPWKEIRSADVYPIPASTLVLPLSGYEDAKGIENADPAAGKELVAKSGHRDGRGLPPLVILVPEGGSDAVRVAGIMKKAWEEALPSLKVDIETVAGDAYFARLRSGPTKGRYTMGLTAWIGDFADPYAFLGMFTTNSNLNDAGYKNRDYDSLLAKAEAEGRAQRFKTLAQAESKLLADAAVLPLYHNLAVNVIDPNYIVGWYDNALDIHPFKYMHFGTKQSGPNVALLGGRGSAAL